MCIESAREHGPYSLIREQVSVASAAFRKNLTPDGDIEAARVSYAKA